MPDEIEKARLLRILDYRARCGENVVNLVEVATEDLTPSLFFALEAAKERHGRRNLYSALADFLWMEHTQGRYCRERHLEDGGSIEPSRAARMDLVEQSLDRAAFFCLRAAENFRERIDA